MVKGWLHYIRNLSIPLAMRYLLLVCYGATLVTTFLVMRRVHQRDLEAANSDWQEHFGGQLAAALAPPLWQLSEDAVIYLASAAFSDPRVAQITIYEKNTKTFDRLNPKVNYVDQKADDFITTNQNITFDSHSIGTLYIRFSTREMHAKQFEFDITMLIVLFSLTLFTLLLASRLVRIKLYAPLERLLGASKSITLERQGDPEVWPWTDEPHLIGRELERIRMLVKSSVNDSLRKNTSESRYELSQAVELGMLLPPPDVTGLRIRKGWMSATQMGGDWYAFAHNTIDRHVYILTGDVTGKGVPSALLLTLVHGGFHSLTQALCKNELFQAEHRFPEKMLELLARTLNSVVLAANSSSHRCMTMAFLCIELDNGIVHFMNAGHTHPLHFLRSENTVNPMKASGSPLGLSSDPKFQYTSVYLSPGDVVLAYTDGLTENKGPDGKRISIRQLRGLFNRESDVDTFQLTLDKLIAETWQGEPLEDDYSYVLFQWDGGNKKTETPALHKGGPGLVLGNEVQGTGI